MLQRLELDALNADLAATEALLAKAESYGDVIGQIQLSHQKNQIIEAIDKIQSTNVHTGKVALFFGGGPVIGSHGVEADFAGRAISTFQDIVERRMALAELGELGARGPIPLKRSAQLMVTDVVRGSFGFVLEEAATDQAITDTELNVVLDQVSNIVFDIASIDADRFDSILNEIDGRLLTCLKNLFSLLDDARASFRIVHQTADHALNRNDIQRGRSRIDRAEIEEKETSDLTGFLLGLLPEHKKFELRRSDTGEIIYGSVDSRLARRFLSGDLLIKSGNPIGRTWRTSMVIRELRQPGKESKFSFILKDIFDTESN